MSTEAQKQKEGILVPGQSIKEMNLQNYTLYFIHASISPGKRQANTTMHAEQSYLQDNNIFMPSEWDIIYHAHTM